MSPPWHSVSSTAWDMLEATAYHAALKEDSPRISWDESCKALMGFSAAELAESELLPELLGSAFNMWLNNFYRVLRTGERYRWEHDVFTPKGVRRVGHIMGRTEPGVVVGVLRDLSATREARQVWEESVQTRLDVLDDLPVGVRFIDSDHRLRWTNKLGMSQSARDERYRDDNRPSFMGKEPGLPAGRGPKDGNVSISAVTSPDGATWLLTAVPVHNQAGRRIGAVEVITNAERLIEIRRTLADKLEYREMQLAVQDKALMALHGHTAGDGADRHDALRAVTRTAAHILEAERAAIWMREGDAARRVDAYERATDTHSSKDRTLPLEECGEYIEKFKLARHIMIPDTERDELMPGLSAGLFARGVKSVLLCPVCLSGEPVGLIVVEYGALRQWSLEEQAFGASLADFAALTIGHIRLRESRRSLSTLISNLPGMAFRLRRRDMELCFEAASAEGLDTAGPLQADVLGTERSRAVDIVYPDDREAFYALHNEPRPTEQPVVNVFRILRPNGEIRWILESCRAIEVDAVGVPQIFEGFLLDVSERYRRKEAEMVSRAKSDFLAAMSHEIRTPMNAVIGLAHLVLKTALAPRQRDCIEKIQSAAKSLLGIINDILDFSKIEAGKMPVEAVPFLLDDMLADLASLFGRVAFDKGLRFLLTIEPDVPREVVGDSVRIAQILTNFLSNAFKFTAKGEVSLRCFVETQPDATSRLCFSVRDTGIGMTEDQRRQLFIPFFQGDASITRKYGGTGLGLAISKMLADLMLGEITVDSESGGGATMGFSFPLDVREGKAKDRPSKLPQDLRMLVVEPCAATRSIIRDIAVAYGCNVRTAADIPSALVWALAAEQEGRPYGVAVLEESLPNVKLFRESLHTPPRLIALATGGCCGNDDFEQPDAVLSKPVVRGSLLEAVHRVLSAKPRVESESDGDIPRFDGREVLLAEDNPINRQIAVELLEDTGMKVTVAGNGYEALMRLRERASKGFDLVLMDLQMPEMDGYQAVRLIRADPAYMNMPILAMTAHAMVDELERCLDLGMNGYITKPIDVQVMYTTLRKFLETPARADA